jgi:hypothetical protein
MPEYFDLAEAIEDDRKRGKINENGRRWSDISVNL